MSKGLGGYVVTVLLLASSLTLAFVFLQGASFPAHTPVFPQVNADALNAAANQTTQPKTTVPKQNTTQCPSIATTVTVVSNPAVAGTTTMSILTTNLITSISVSVSISTRAETAPNIAVFCDASSRYYNPTLCGMMGGVVVGILALGLGAGMALGKRGKAESLHELAAE